MIRRLLSRIALFLPIAAFLILVAYNAVGPLLANPNRAEELDGSKGIPVELVYVIAFGATLTLGGLGLIVWYTLHGDKWQRRNDVSPRTPER